MEKKITIKQISGIFTKDFDSFGKMDPFLEFKLGKNLSKTEVASDMGKEPKWKNEICQTYFDEQAIEVTAYDSDVTENQFMGTAKILLGSIKDQGQQTIQFYNKENESIGKVTFKYTVDKLKPAPLLFIKNICCNLDKDINLVLKAKPYLQVKSDDNQIATEKKEEAARLMNWDQRLRLRVNQKSNIQFTLLDAQDAQAKIFTYKAAFDGFMLQKGTKIYNVFGSTYEPLGTLKFDFETQNIVNSSESAKNQQAIEKGEKELTRIQIVEIKGKLAEVEDSFYLKILVGSKMFKTEPIQSSKKDFFFKTEIPFYAQSKEERITLALFDKNILKDQILGTGHISLKDITSGDKAVQLFNKQNKEIGSINIFLTAKKCPSKTIRFSKIHVKTEKSADFITKQDPYTTFTIGGWSERTQTGEGKDFTFEKNLELKYSTQETLNIELMEEDVTSDKKIGFQNVDLTGLKVGKQTRTINLVKIQKEDNKEKEKIIGTLSFQYQLQAPESNLFSKKKISEKSDKAATKTNNERKISEKKNLDEQPRTTKIISQSSSPSKSKVNQDSSQNEASNKNQLKNKNDQQLQPSNQLNERSINEYSKDTFKLPGIGVDSSRNYGDRIFDKQSSATLQKSIHVFSMPKGQRFNSGPKYSGQPSYYVDTCFKASPTKGAGFGFGSKRQFPEWMQRNMKQNPPPGAYFDQGPKTEFRPRGPTFGIAHKYYEKVTIPKETSKEKSFVAKSSQRLKPLRRHA